MAFRREAVCRADPLDLGDVATAATTVRRGGSDLFDGVPAAPTHGREVHMNEDIAFTSAWDARKAVLRRGVRAQPALGGRRGEPSP